MKKQRKQLVIMLVLLGFLIIAYFALGAYNDAQENKEQEETETITVTDLKYEDVIAFSYHYKEENNSFIKSGEEWMYDADQSFDVDETKIEDMLSAACKVKAEDYFDAYESLDNYGLDEPQCVINISFTNGSTVKLQIGNYNDMVGYYYMMKEGDNNLYLIDVALYNAFSVSYTDLEYIVEDTEITEE